MGVQTNTPNAGTGLQRSVGFWGLMFVSLGSILGSGWLLSALRERACCRDIEVFEDHRSGS